MVMREQQEPRSPQLGTTRMASDEPPQLPRLGLMTGGSAAAMATGDMACGSGGGEEERGLDEAPDNVYSTSPWVALLPVVGSTSLVSICSTIASPQFQRKRRSHVPRAALSHKWSLEKLPVLPPTAAKEARRKRAAEVEPEPAAAAPAPGNEEDKPEKWCVHCGITSTLQWRMGPEGEGTLCNPCGLRYRQGRLVPEYRPKASPTFNESVHSNEHRAVLQIRQKQDHPAQPAPYHPIRTRRKREGKGQQELAQVLKKHEGNKEKNQPAQAQPAAVPVLQMTQHLPPPLAQPHAGVEPMTDEPLPPPDPFLFEGPAAPMIIEDDEPVVVIVIDDD